MHKSYITWEFFNFQIEFLRFRIEFLHFQEIEFWRKRTKISPAFAKTQGEKNSANLKFNKPVAI